MTDNRARKRGVSTPPYLCPDGSNPCGRYGYCGHCPHDKSKRMQAMTDKPEVVTFHCYGQSAPAYSCNKPSDNSGEYVRLSDHERLQAEAERLQADHEADKARIEELVEALGSMTCAYRMAIQAGHARITALGGDCDSVGRMLADFPDYGRSVELYKSCRASPAQQGKEGET